MPARPAAPAAAAAAPGVRASRPARRRAVRRLGWRRRVTVAPSSSRCSWSLRLAYGGPDGRRRAFTAGADPLPAAVGGARGAAGHRRLPGAGRARPPRRRGRLPADPGPDRPCGGAAAPALGAAALVGARRRRSAPLLGGRRDRRAGRRGASSRSRPGLLGYGLFALLHPGPVRPRRRPASPAAGDRRRLGRRRGRRARARRGAAAGPTGCSRSAPANSVGMPCSGGAAGASRARAGRRRRARRAAAGAAGVGAAGGRAAAAAGRAWAAVAGVGTLGAGPQACVAAWSRACWPVSWWRSSSWRVAYAAGPAATSRPAGRGGCGRGGDGAGRVGSIGRRSGRDAPRHGAADWPGRGRAGAGLQHRRRRPARGARSSGGLVAAGCRGDGLRAGRHRGAVRLHRRRAPRSPPVEIPASPQPAATSGAVARAAPGADRPRADVVHAHGLRAGLRRRAGPPAPAPLVVTWHNAVLAGGLRGAAAPAGRAGRRPRRRRHPRRLRRPGRPGRARSAPGTPGSAPVAAPPLPPPRRSRAAVRAELGVAADAPLILVGRPAAPAEAATTCWSTPPPGGATSARPPVVAIAGAGPGYMRRWPRGSPRPAPRSPCSATATTSPTCSPRADLARGHQRLGGAAAVRAGGAARRRAAGRHRASAACPSWSATRARAGPAGRRGRARRGRARAARPTRRCAPSYAARGPRAGRDLARPRPTRSPQRARRLRASWPRDRSGGRRLRRGVTGCAGSLRRPAGAVPSRWPARPPLVARPPAGRRRPPAAAPTRRLRGHRRRRRACAGTTSTRAHARRCGGWPSAARSAALSVRSAQRHHLPRRRLADAGRRQLRGLEHERPVAGGVPAAGRRRSSRPDGIGAVPARPAPRSCAHNQEQLPWGAVPGALAESVRCTVAVGPGAAVAAARPFGRVDRYAADAARRPAPTLLVGVRAQHRRPRHGRRRRRRPRRAAAAARADARPGPGARRPPGALAGAGRRACPTPTDRPRLHVAIADGPGWDGGWLDLGRAPAAPATCSWSTSPRPRWPRWAGPRPSGCSSGGRPRVGRRAGPPTWPRRSAAPADADRRGRRPARVGTGFFGCWRSLQLLLFAAVVPLLLRAPPARRADRARAGAAPAGGAASRCCWSRRRWRSRPRCSPTRCRGGAPGTPGCCSPLVDAGRCWRWPPPRSGCAAVPRARSGRWAWSPPSPRPWSASTCSPARGCSSTAWPATRRCEGGRYAGIGTVGLGVLRRRRAARRRLPGPAGPPAAGGRPSWCVVGGLGVVRRRQPVPGRGRRSARSR